MGWRSDVVRGPASSAPRASAPPPPPPSHHHYHHPTTTVYTFACKRNLGIGISGVRFRLTRLSQVVVESRFHAMFHSVPSHLWKRATRNSYRFIPAATRVCLYRHGRRIIDRRRFLRFFRFLPSTFPFPLPSACVYVQRVYSVWILLEIRREVVQKLVMKKLGWKCRSRVCLLDRKQLWGLVSDLSKGNFNWS